MFINNSNRLAVRSDSTSSFGFAFTLAEVLITLGIIGVVASLTVPALMNNVGNQANKTAAKKSFSVLSSAVEMIVSENGGSLSNVFPTGGDAVTLFSEKMNVVKKCNNAQADGCWPASYTSGPAAVQVAAPGIILNDGTMVVFYFYSSNCDYVHGLATGVCADLFVDTNGAKKPNKAGQDILVFLMYKDMLRIGGTNNDYYEQNSSYYTCTNNVGYLCQLDFFNQ